MSFPSLKLLRSNNLLILFVEKPDVDYANIEFIEKMLIFVHSVWATVDYNINKHLVSRSVDLQSKY